MSEFSVQDVSVAQSSGADEYSFLDDSGNVVDDNGASSSSDAVVAQQELTASTNQPVDTAVDTAMDAAAADADKAKQQAKDQLPYGVKRRIDKLTARAKQQEELNRNLALENERYKKAFELLQEQYSSKQDRFKQIDDIDPRDAELERVRFENKVRRAQEELDQQYKQRIMEAERQARIDQMAERIIEEVEEAVTKYPTVSHAEIAIAIRNNPDLKIDDAARMLHERRYKALEQEFTSKYKDRLNAPKTVSANGTSAKRVLRTDQDLIEELDQMFGPDWHQR